MLLLELSSNYIWIWNKKSEDFWFSMRIEEVQGLWKSQFRPHHIQDSLWCLKRHRSFILTPTEGRGLTWGGLPLWLRNWVELMGFWLKSLPCSRWRWASTMQSCAGKQNSCIDKLCAGKDSRCPLGLANTVGVSCFPKWPCKITKFPPFTGRVIIERAVELGAGFLNVLRDLEQIT